MQQAALLARLEALVIAPTHGDDAPSLEQVEVTLTDGYAEALALEAERARLARRIGALAALDGGDAGARSRELSLLSRQLLEAEGKLSGLRSVLVRLRRRATAQRTALV
jgi:hypothetical protein